MQFIAQPGGPNFDDMEPTVKLGGPKIDNMQPTVKNSGGIMQRLHYRYLNNQVP